MSRHTPLNPVQQEIQARGLLSSGFACVLQMPTGSGKTWLAEEAIAEVLERGERAVYLTPLRALANELLTRWKRRFSRFPVGVFTGEYGQRQRYPVPFEDARLLIMTPERLDACTRNWRSHWAWVPQVSLLVVDELHLLGDRGRGPRLEGALLRARRLNPFLQIIGLSATLGNRSELADWLDGVHFGSVWRPIPIQWRYARYQRATDKPRILCEEVQRCVKAGGQSLVFVQSRRRAEWLSCELNKSGIAAEHHHAGLESTRRQKLERQYRAGELRALVSTGTLEMGLNLPARQVVLYDLQAFDGTDFVPLSVNTVWQRAGRAGRRGLDTQGEVVFVAPSWDRSVERYAHGRFEEITSGLEEPRAVAEQVLAELSSGLARTRAQLTRNMQQSLAAHQRRLPALDRIVEEMIESGMLVETADPESPQPKLKATRLGRIAVRQMLTPATVVTLARALQALDVERLTLFDVLLLCIASDDCDTRIPADFAELDELGALLSAEPSTWLAAGAAEAQRQLGVGGKRLLTVIKTALVLRHWTRGGDAEEVAERFGCYAFELRRLSESVARILTAAVAVATPPKGPECEEVRPEFVFADEPSVRERLRALLIMVSHALDEQAVTLTYVKGIGSTLARRLWEIGITDIEALARAEAIQVANIRGVSVNRAQRWIEQAEQTMRDRSAFSFRETGACAQSSAGAWDSAVDPYRLGRAMSLKVRTQGDSFSVTGGLEPHQVQRRDVGWICDCSDFGKGRLCKHVLAVRLHHKDADLGVLVERMSNETRLRGLDLFHLWFGGGRL